MQDELISIIVPVYKVEKYLKRCIESLINQKYKNIEIILIDDGSPDNSGKICDDYAKIDDRIIVIHKENGGVSSARNAGLDIAKGKYITFMDSDDFVSSEYCLALYSAINENSAQISFCELNTFYEDVEIEEDMRDYSETKYNTEQIIYTTVVKGGFYDCIGGKMYASDFFLNQRFPIGRFYEDASIIYKLYSAAQKIVCVNKKYYYYLRGREDSISSAKSYNQKNQHDDYQMFSERYEYLLPRFPKIRDGLIAGYIRTSINLFQMSYMSSDKSLITSNIFKKLENELPTLIKTVDKNILSEALNNYRLACLYLFIQNREVYIKVINELYLKRNENN